VSAAVTGQGRQGSSPTEMDDGPGVVVFAGSLLFGQPNVDRSGGTVGPDEEGEGRVRAAW
jgi:hypothetical protein